MTNNIGTKVLVVDDLAEKLLVYRSILEEPGLELTTVSSGADALRQVLEHEFAVILLDVKMPVMDGFETARLIRSRKRSAHTPIIFLTSHTDELHALRGYASGAVDYILTPVVPDILRTKVRVFVQLFRLNQQVRDQAARQIATAEREQAHLTDLLERATDFVVRVDAAGDVLHVNRGGRQMLGFSDGDELPSRLQDYQPAWAAEVLRSDGLPTAKREGVWFGESALRKRSGEDVPVSNVILAHYTPDGELEHFSIVARDVSDRKRAEAELARHRAHLEDLVRERTVELEASHERLRLADRLASIGTLAAGLGHDMGNLLLPVRIRIEALERMDLPTDAKEDVRGIAEACEYLRRLSQGLRLFALSPSDPRASGDRTDVAAWWDDVAPFLRNALQRGIQLESRIPPGLPPLAIPPHMLTQAVYNLVQNAGEALRGRPAGRVTIGASVTDDTRNVVLEVADNGPGMAEAVLRRCIEPFFTTKPRGISTGLGLALVSGALNHARGTIDIQSSPGEGAKFRLSIPVWTAPTEPAAPRRRSDAGSACVSLRDAQLRAYVSSELRSLEVEVEAGPWSQSTAAPLLVLDDLGERASELETFLEADPARRAVVLGGQPNGLNSDRVSFLEPRPAPLRLRTVLRVALGTSEREMESAKP